MHKWIPARADQEGYREHTPEHAGESIHFPPAQMRFLGLQKDRDLGHSVGSFFWFSQKNQENDVHEPSK